MKIHFSIIKTLNRLPFLIDRSGFLLAGILMYSGCTSKVQQEDLKTNEAPAVNLTVSTEQFNHNNMQWGKATEKTFFTFVDATGHVESPPAGKASISPMFGGYVKRFNLLPGNRIHKGQVLFSIENPDFIDLQREFLELKEQLVFLKSDFESQQVLSSENISSKKEFHRAQALYKSSIAKYEGIKKKLQLMGIAAEQLNTSSLVSEMNILAPIAGFITEIKITNGKYINPEDVALQILNATDNHVDLHVLESDILKVKAGQKILFTLGQDAGKMYEGEIALVGKEVNEGNRSVEVHAHPHHIKGERLDYESIMLPGMFVQAKIITNTHNNIAVPEAALIRQGQTFVVLYKKTVQEGMILFDQVVITPGISMEGWVEVLKGDLKDKEILVAGGENLIF